MTSYVVQCQTSGSDTVHIMGTYSSLSDAVALRDLRITESIVQGQLDFPDSTFDIQNSSDEFVTFIRRTFTSSYNDSFSGTSYPEIILSTTTQVPYKKIGVVVVVNP